MYKYPYGDSQQLNLDWILAKLKELEEGGAGGGASLETVSNALISLTYNSSTQYRRYDYAFLNGKLYRCLSDTSGAFDPAAWQEALIGDDLAVLTRWINAIDAAAVVDVKFDTSGTNGKIQQKYHDNYHDVVEVDYTPVQNSKRPLSSNAGFLLNGAIKTVFNGKKALIIGDSYNKGQNNHGWGYYFKTVTGMGNNVTSIQQNGGGFGRVAQSGSDYPGEYYYQAIAHISTAIDFDYIIAQAGRNDAYSPEDTTGATLINGINQFVSVCKARWPNAKVFIFPTNNDSPLDDAHYKFMRLIPETALKNGVFTSFQSFKWFYDTNLNHSDGAHLVESGYELLAQYIASSIAGWNGILPEQKYDHKNLLINSVFAKFIVNNRGITTTPTGASKKCLFDCWFGARAEVTVNTDSVSMKWDGTNGSNGYLAQRHLEIERNAHVTMSAVIDNKLYFKTWTLNANQTTYNYQVNSQLYFRLELFSDGSAQFTLYNYSTTALVISGIKLEYGNEQTLATEYEGNLIIIDGTTYSEEIQRCRTMLIPIYYNIGVGQNQYYCGVRGYSNAKAVAYEIPDLRKMVGSPTLEYDTLQGAVIDREGTSRSITDIAINGNMGIYFTVADDLATGTQAIYFNRIVYITSE